MARKKEQIGKKKQSISSPRPSMKEEKSCISEGGSPPRLAYLRERGSGGGQW